MKKVKSPEKKAGIWLDQQNAFIVWITNEGDTLLKKISSSVESRIRIPGEEAVVARFGNAFIGDEEKKQRRQKNQREKFYRKIIDLIKEADRVFIFGPGRAKQGLGKAIENDNNFNGRIVEIRAADKMSEKGIRSFVAEFYGLSKPRQLDRKLKTEG